MGRDIFPLLIILRLSNTARRIHAWGVRQILARLILAEMCVELGDHPSFWV